MANSIKFDNTEIRGTTYVPRFVKHESAAERQLITADLSGEDGSVLVSSKYGVKSILIRGIITGTSQDNLESNIDTLQELLSRQEKNLDIEWNGGTRRYVATCKRLDFDRDHFHILFAPYEAEFVVLSGEGKDTAETTPKNEEIIVGSDYLTATFTMAGSKGAKPTIKLTMKNSFPAAVKGIEIKNNDTGDRIIFTKNDGFDDSEYVLFDYINKKVQANITGSLVDYDFYGKFSKFLIGTNTIKIKAGGISCQEAVPATLYLANQTIKATTTRVAQSFMVPKTDETFKGLSMLGYKVGSPGNITAEIYADSGNKPYGSAIASITFNAAAFGTSSLADWISAYAASIFTLSANTKYWVVLSAAGVDNSNYYVIYTAGSDIYNKGNLATSTDSGSTYTQSVSNDLDFKLLFGGAPGTSYFDLLIKYYKTYL